MNGESLTILDAHAHFFDPTRPQGVPWPEPDDAALFRPVFPEEFQQLTAPLGVRGVIAVEASPWLEDNAWLLELTEKSPIVLGVVGNLDPGGADFRRDLERFAHHPRFRGIRLGSRARDTLTANIANTAYLDDLRALAAKNLALDLLSVHGTGGGGAAMLATAMALAERVPALRIVVQHLPFEQPLPAALRHYPQIFAKVAKILPRASPISRNMETYRAQLDDIWATFGPERLIYGNDWPVSSRLAPYHVLFELLHAYVLTHGQQATGAFFAGNAARAYALPGFA